MTETVDGSDEDVAYGEYEAKHSKKKERKRQEREAQRQVSSFSFFLSFLICFNMFSPYLMV